MDLLDQPMGTYNTVVVTKLGNCIMPYSDFGRMYSIWYTVYHMLYICYINVV